MKSSNKNPHLIKVGKVIDGHSLKGEIKVHLFSREAAWIKQLKTATLKTLLSSGSETAKEYAVETARVNEAIAFVKLAGIPDRTQADKLKGAEFWISEDLLSSKPGETIYLREILNFKVVARDGKTIGIVKGFESNNLQDLLIVDVSDDAIGSVEGKPFQALIPLIKPFLILIDYKSQTITMDLPEGLIEANRAL